MEAERRNFTIFSLSVREGPNTNEMGIVGTHAYSVLSAIECEYGG